MKYTKIIKFALVFTLLPFLASADFSAGNWQYKKSINLEGQNGENYVQFKIDKEIYGHSSLSDIRIVDYTGVEIPYQLVVKEASYALNTYPVRILNASTDSGNNLAFIADLGQSGQTHNKIDLRIPNANFKRKVHIFASDSLVSVDSSAWRKLTDAGYIFKFTDKVTGFSTEQTSVYYPEATSRYLKIVVDDGEEGHLSIYSSASVMQAQNTEAVQDFFDLQAIISQNNSEKTTEIIADIGSGGIPTNMVSLDFLSDNFNRQAIVEVSNDKINWQSVGRGYLFSVNTAKYSGKNPEIYYPETQARFYRVKVFNEDNQPVKFAENLSVRSVSRNIVFKGNSENQFKVYYGNPSARVAHYDLAKLFEYIETQNIPFVTLGVESPNNDYLAPKAPVVPLSERYPYLLNSVLFVLILIIVAFVFLFIRKQKMPISSSPMDQQEESLVDKTPPTV